MLKWDKDDIDKNGPLDDFTKFMEGKTHGLEDVISEKKVNKDIEGGVDNSGGEEVVNAYLDLDKLLNMPSDKRNEYVLSLNSSKIWVMSVGSLSEFEGPISFSDRWGEIKGNSNEGVSDDDPQIYLFELSGIKIGTRGNRSIELIQNGITYKVTTTWEHGRGHYIDYGTLVVEK